MTRLLRSENGKAGSLDPLPYLPSPSSAHFSKSCWYNLGHIQHLHLQSVLRSIDSYEYFIGQDLSANSGLRSRAKEAVLGSAVRKCPQGLGDLLKGGLLPPTILPRKASLSICTGKESRERLWPTVPPALVWVPRRFSRDFFKPPLAADTLPPTRPPGFPGATTVENTPANAGDAKHPKKKKRERETS